MLWIIPAIIISYLVGSIPTAYLFGRFLKGIDIRKFGSGNVGATNALRVLGKGPGITVLLLDMAKGAIAVLFLPDIFAPRTGMTDTAISVILGLACILGHNWTVFLKFRGGKGVATTFGVLLGLAFKIEGLRLIFALVILTWAFVFTITRMVSLASILSAVAIPVYMFIFKEPLTLILAGVLLAIFIILRHRGNLRRVFQGKEPRISFKKPA